MEFNKLKYVLAILQEGGIKVPEILGSSPMIKGIEIVQRPNGQKIDVYPRHARSAQEIIRNSYPGVVPQTIYHALHQLVGAKTLGQMQLGKIKITKVVYWYEEETAISGLEDFEITTAAANS